MVCAWAKDQRTKIQVGRGKHCLLIFKEQLDSRNSFCTIWRPFRESQYMGLPIVRDAYILSTKRVIFFDPESSTGFWYLGDRAWRQLHDDIAVPIDPPIRSTLSKVPDHEFFYYRDQGWKASSNYVIPTSEGEYRIWWERVSIGSIIPPAVHDINKDTVSIAASQNRDVQITCPPPLGDDTYAYELIPPAKPWSDYVNWTLDIQGSSGTVETIPVASRSESTTFHPTDYNPRDWSQFSAQMVDLDHQLRRMSFDQCRIRDQTIARQAKELEWYRAHQAEFERAHGIGTSTLVSSTRQFMPEYVPSTQATTWDPPRHLYQVPYSSQQTTEFVPSTHMY